MTLLDTEISVGFGIGVFSSVFHQGIPSFACIYFKALSKSLYIQIFEFLNITHFFRIFANYGFWHYLTLKITAKSVWFCQNHSWGRVILQLASLCHTRVIYYKIRWSCTIYPPVLRDLNSQFGQNSWFSRFWHTRNCNISSNMQYAVFSFNMLLVRTLRYLHICVTLRFRPFILLFYAFSIRNLVEIHDFFDFDILGLAISLAICSMQYSIFTGY